MNVRSARKKVTVMMASVVLLVAGCRGQESPSRESGAQDASVQSVIPEPDASTRQMFDETMAYARAQNLHERPLGEIMIELGERFMAKPYAAGMLDEPATERLVCTLNRFDCVTFIESMLAMGRVVEQQQYAYETWARHMLDQRYRGGALDGYCSRLHYFTDWILDNERRGNVRNITEEIGGLPFDKQLTFMTEHRESYPRFAENDSVYACIEDMEERLVGIPLHYIPQERISEAYDRLESGDLVAMATHLEGLDVVHTGLVYDTGDGMGLLHASTSGGVKVSPDLQSYVEGVGSQIGIIVARPVSRR